MRNSCAPTAGQSHRPCLLADVLKTSAVYLRVARLALMVLCAAAIALAVKRFSRGLASIIVPAAARLGAPTSVGSCWERRLKSASWGTRTLVRAWSRRARPKR